jgi:DNA-binding transcriptional LysR family regulator
MLRFTLRQLEHAQAIAEHGSLAAAAQALGVAQPSLSASLQKLEQQLGLQLFIRQHAQGAVPSPQGQRFLMDAKSLIAQAMDFERSAASAGEAVAGELRLGSFHTLAPAYAPRLIKTFQQRYPQARITLEEGAQEQLVDGLRSGRFDHVLLYKLDQPADIRITELLELEPRALLSADHRLARRRSVTLHELAQEPFILLDMQPSRTYFLRLLAGEGIEPKVSFASPSIELVRGLVGQGLGYSLLITRPHGDHAYDGSRLAIVPLKDKVEKGVIALATLRTLRPTRLVSTFEEFCGSFFRSIPS